MTKEILGNRFKEKEKVSAESEKKRCKVSICIPTYNRKEFIDVALSHLEGALKNVSFPIEVIISDNHSEVLRDYFSQTDRCGNISHIFPLFSPFSRGNTRLLTFQQSFQQVVQK